MTYQLRDHSVTTRHFVDGTQFVTRNASGETISTVHLSPASSALMIAQLERQCRG